jgi:LCP family protein required for cell wall assembly
MPQNKKQLQKRFFTVLFFLLLTIGAYIFYKVISYAPVAYELIFKKDIELKQDEKKNINMLLLGIGGGQHDGPLLTDTIIFMSINPEENRVTLVTIPRDLWVPELQAKINTAYAYAEQKKPGGGLILTKRIVGKILNQDIDYGFRIDFNGFIRAIDMVGGIDIDVERTFDDYEYPISGKETDTCGYEGEEFEKRATAEGQLEAFPCRYEHLHFEKGYQHMDGETALKYVRSRHAQGPEGTDFARSKRQEKVINAFKEKVFSAETFLNPIKLVSLYDIFKDSIDTDIKQEEYADFVKLAEKMKDAKIESFVLDVGDDAQGRLGLLMNPTPSEEYKFQWVIVPRAGNGNYREIQEYVLCLVEKQNCKISPTVNPQVSKKNSF